MINEARIKDITEKSIKDFDEAAKSGKISDSELAKMEFRAHMSKNMPHEEGGTYVGGLGVLSSDEEKRLQEFFGHEEYVAEGIDAISPNKIFEGTVNEILPSSSEEVLGFSYQPEGKELPLIVIRNTSHPGFEDIKNKLKLGSKVKVSLDERGHISTVEILDEKEEK